MPVPKTRKMAVAGSRSVGQSKGALGKGYKTHWLTITTYPGKSSLTVQLCEHHFVDSYYPTIENTFSTPIRHKGNDYAMEIVDTAGTVRMCFSS